MPATVVNWAGHQDVSIEEWSAYLAALVGREASFTSRPAALESVSADTTRLRSLGARTSVDWRDDSLRTT